MRLFYLIRVHLEKYSHNLVQIMTTRKKGGHNSINFIVFDPDIVVIYLNHLGLKEYIPAGHYLNLWLRSNQ